MTVHKRTPEARQELRAQMLTSDRWTISHPNLSPNPQLSPELTLTVSIPPTAPSAVLTDAASTPPLRVHPTLFIHPTHIGDNSGSLRVYPQLR